VYFLDALPYMISMRIFLAVLLCVCSLAGQAGAFFDGPNCRIYWNAYQVEDDAAGKQVLLALTLVPPSGHYLYGPDIPSGGVGLPTRMDVQFAPLDAFPMTRLTGRQIDELLKAGGQALPVLFPAPVPKKDTAFALVAFPGSGDGNPDIYAGPVTFWTQFPMSPPGLGGALVRARMSGLLCSEGSCMPASGELELAFSAAEMAALPPASAQTWWTALRQGEDVLIPPPTGASGEDVFSRKEPRGAGTSISRPVDKTSEHTALYATLEPAFFNPALEVHFIGGALLFGLLAGLLLNLMPCVLPVVSLKFSALMAVSAMADRQQQARAFKVHCLIFAAGIMAWFVVLAMLLGVAGWAWGELFQHPVVIALLGMLLFVLGLSLFGVFHLPIFDFKVTSDKHPHWQSFASGLLATLLATPCSGPLLGGVLAWAIRQPLPVLILCVLSVGVGMALPYCVLAIFPRLVHLLPRPGSWTMRLEQLLGFFLMGSVVYLANLLPKEWLPPFLFTLFAVALACWLWGQIGHLRASPLRRIIARVAAALVVLFAVWWGSYAIRTDATWEAFDPQIFTELLGKEPMLLEFTADWCPSCKVLEYTTLNQTRMADLRRRYNVRTIRVDLTRDEGAGRYGKELLKALGSTSIPVLALFPVGENAHQPVVLRDLVTPAQLEEAAARTF
jgi:thiol:disulfide interchange protein DsbD